MDTGGARCVLSCAWKGAHLGLVPADEQPHQRAEALSFMLRS